jgi:hypothetical protein
MQLRISYRKSNLKERKSVQEEAKLFMCWAKQNAMNFSNVRKAPKTRRKKEWKNAFQLFTNETEIAFCRWLVRKKCEAFFILEFYLLLSNILSPLYPTPHFPYYICIVNLFWGQRYCRVEKKWSHTSDADALHGLFLHSISPLWTHSSENYVPAALEPVNYCLFSRTLQN